MVDELSQFQGTCTKSKRCYTTFQNVFRLLSSEHDLDCLFLKNAFSPKGESCTWTESVPGIPHKGSQKDNAVGTIGKHVSKVDCGLLWTSRNSPITGLTGVIVSPANTHIV